MRTIPEGPLHSASLALALTLSTATQLRLTGLPVGPGELLLLGFLAWAGFGVWRDRRQWRGSRVGHVFGGFWLVALMALLVGAIVAERQGVPSHGMLLHDAAAYGFVACCSVALGWPRPAEGQTHRAVWWLALGILVIGSGLWIYGHVDQYGLGLDLWYGGLGVRFLGWAVNPNQMALLLVLAPFLGLYILTAAFPGTGTGTALWGSLTACAMAAGWATDSGALRVAWSVCIPLLAVIHGIAVLRGASWRPLILLIACVLMAATMLALAAWVESASTPLEAPTGALGQRAGMDMESMELAYVKNDDVSVRSRLMVHGWEAFRSSPLFGLGPGAFSGLQRPFQGSEAHNSLIDWGTNTGLVGVAALLALVGWVAVQLLRAGQWALLVGLLALAVFSLAHHVLRHPLVWGWLVLAARLALEIQSRNARTCAA